jgi:hypothetical protein
MPHNPLPARLASHAQSIVDTLDETSYQHVENIDEAAGVFDCDCNGFVGYVLEQEAPLHYGLIPKEADQQRPRAFEFYDFFSSLKPASHRGWQRIDLLGNARRGDILVWRFPEIEQGHDTGHVMFLAETPVEQDVNPLVQQDASLSPERDPIAFSVRVYDSVAQPHFDDTRGPGQTGVGSGCIKLQVNDAGQPVSFLFAPSDQYTTLPIVIGRAEPLASLSS